MYSWCVCTIVVVVQHKSDIVSRGGQAEEDVCVCVCDGDRMMRRLVPSSVPPCVTLIRCSDGR